MEKKIICDVVLNSIWYDPRVRKQIIEYSKSDYNVQCVGLKDDRFDKDNVDKIPVKTYLVKLPDKYNASQRSLIGKIRREYITNKLICQEIVKTKCDVIHANDLNALIPAYKASKRLKCRLVYDSHEVFVENFFAITKTFIKRIYALIYKSYLFFQEKRIIKKVDLMVCVSNSAADYFENKYKIKKPTVVTNCPIKSEIDIFQMKNNGFEVLNHGMFYNGRGYDIMVKALPFLKEYPTIKLALRGFGSLEEWLKNEAKKNNNQDQIVFYKKVKTDELVKYASLSHVGVAITEPICLNFKLSISNKIFEYAAAGIPVIMSNIPEHVYLNNKYNFGIVISNNTPECFADAVIRLYKDHDLYKKLCSNTRKLVDDLYWEKEFRKIIDFIEEGKND